MIQTWAILVDAYRELNAKRLFWFVLGISMLVVGAFAAVGINENGLTVLWWDLPSVFNTTMFTPAAFYKTMFLNLGIGIWLGWIAAILALVSTAGMFPDFIQGGAIELTLSKPIGRLRLFLTKYAAGLLFVGLQVLVFSGASFLVIGIRGGSWVPGLFLAVPLLLLFFSYLFSVCALLGLVTRSTNAALLLTLLFWFLLFGVNTTENVFQSLRLQREMQVETGTKNVGELEARLAALQSAPAETSAAPAKPPEPKPTQGGVAALAGWALRNSAEPDKARDREDEIREARSALEDMRERTEKAVVSSTSMTRWHRIFFGVKTALPKTAETTQLLKRVLVKQADMDRMMNADGGGGEQPPMMDFDSESVRIDAREFGRRLEQAQRTRSTWWIVGTSLVFEGVVLALGALVFVRRDF